ncbi:MAG: heliorhodopsin HeR [Candidatus Dojkabacteria bacterium]|nr:MAG: heliorhodopsin HeR [Candidatus Dojkabacteria bacterium]
MNTENSYKKLRKWNAIMAVLHFVQGIAMLAISRDFSIPLTTTYLDFNLQANTILPVTNEAMQLNLGQFISVFLFLSAFFHFLLILPGIYEWYVKNLKNKINYLRWIEYAFSSSVMIVAIAILCGMFDLPSLILIFGLNAMMNLFGLMMELHNQTTKKTNWTAFIFGTIAGILPWIVIAMYFFGAVSSVGTNIPTFVYAILVSIFLFFNCFAINMFLQYKQVGPWKDYLFGERVYILLSLIAKSALAWQIFSGTLRPM